MHSYKKSHKEDRFERLPIEGGMEPVSLLSERSLKRRINVSKLIYNPFSEDYSLTRRQIGLITCDRDYFKKLEISNSIKEIIRKWSIQFDDKSS